MNYTKYLVGLIIFNFCMAVVANIDYFHDVTPSTDLSLVESTTHSAASGAYSVFDTATFFIDAIILALKLTILAPYYTSLTLQAFGIHPLIAWALMGINYLIYVMWLIDLKRGKPFFY